MPELFGGVTQPSACGCMVAGAGTIDDPRRIVHCPAHREAHCLRCGHDWVPRQAKITICPRCKSHYWDKAKE